MSAAAAEGAPGPGTHLVVLDIGGTHARFALARIMAGGAISLGPATKLATDGYPDLASAWHAFAASQPAPLPRSAAIAIAAPLGAATIRMTNNAWQIAPATLADELRLERLTLVNDFAAIAHAVAQLGPERFAPICGPAGPLPAEGPITVIGPGTGLGVACLHRRDGRADVQATEGGHVGLAPSSPFEDALLLHLRARFGRVSVERACSGPGLVAIYETLALLSGQEPPMTDDRTLWAAALARSDALATAALERFCTLFGSVAGDMALAHGAAGVVLAGGLGQRLGSILPDSGFATGFVTKGRYGGHMASLPVRLVTHPEPGLFGAAAAFHHQHGTRA